MTLKQRAIQNILGKEENAGNQHFLLFPQCFLLYQRKEIIISAALNLSPANAFNFVKAKFVWFGKELNILLKEINFQDAC